MRALQSLALRFDGKRLSILDQTLLPGAEVWVDVTDPRAMIEAIQKLKVRGAPLLGVAAALCLACIAEGGASQAQLESDALWLRRARPTAVNLMWALDRLRHVLERGGSKDDLVIEAEHIFLEDVLLCERMAEHGAGLIKGGESLLTHCNTGGLATVGVGTALGVIQKAHLQNKRIHVYVDETRPLLQGARLTTWELEKLDIPHTLITDSMAAILMRDGRISRVLVGADRIAMNGDFANKVGTYGLAVQAHFHGVPFHPVAPYSTVDTHCEHGSDIPIEERAALEVLGYRELQWAQEGTEVFNPSFDVTPVELVTSLVLDRGVISQAELIAGKLALGV
jgi:methylthioribose-1-phosphate isomerase